MKREVSISHVLGGSTTATIVIYGNEMRVDDKSEYCSDSSVIKDYLTQMIDMDSWNHSWHLNLSNAQFKGSDERKRAEQIMLDKIEQREKEIKQLKDGIQILSCWSIYTD